MDPKTQAHAAAGQSFLGLPPEVRNMIYRILLVNDKTLGSHSPAMSRAEWTSEFGLHPAILRVCSQLHREASSILNSENTIGIYICGFVNEDEEESGEEVERRDSEDECGANIIVMNNRVLYSALISKFQRFEIVIERADYSAVRTEVRYFCNHYLRTMPALRHLGLYLEKDKGRWYRKTLGPFGMLRNMHSVVIHGAPLEFAERLKGLMLGNTPQDNVEEMYRSLKAFARNYNGHRGYLRTAARAREKWDIKKLKEIRSMILPECQRRMDRDLSHIFDHDPKSEEDHQDTSKEDNDCEEHSDWEIEVDHDSKLEVMIRTARSRRMVIDSLGIIEECGLEGYLEEMRSVAVEG